MQNQSARFYTVEAIAGRTQPGQASFLSLLLPPIVYLVIKDFSGFLRRDRDKIQFYH